MCEIVVQLLSHDLLFTTPWTAAHQAFLSFISPRVWSNSCPLSWWCYISFSSSASPLSPCLQSFPASESFPESWFLASGGQSIGTSALASVLPINMQDWLPLWLTSLISLLSKGFSSLLQHHNSKASILWLSVFYTVLLSHPYVTTGNTIALTIWTLLAKRFLCFLICHPGLS